jgi:NUMOD3 motif
MTITFVYKWIHIPTSKWYIGSRTANGCHPSDGYICSSKIVQKMVLENPSEWERKIISTGMPLDMIKLEHTLLDTLDAKNDPQSFNQHNGNSKLFVTGMIRIYKESVNAYIQPEELTFYESFGWKQGMSLKTKEKMISNHADFSKEKNPMFGKNRQGEKSRFYGKHHNEESKKSIGDARRGMESPNKGKFGAVHPAFGSMKSKECRDLISKKLKGRIPWNKGKKSTKIKLINELKIK